MRIVSCMTNPTLAATVTAARAALGLTQAALAEKAGIAERTVQNAEAGKPLSPISLAAIARALDLDPSALWRIAGLGAPAKAAS
jgi:DNA-binding XRE family transcriptional regulator